jgi:tRNA-splicing ligase RtcB
LSYQVIEGVKVWGERDANAVRQAVRCSQVGNVASVALMADHHYGYSQPIGGVVAYVDAISPSGVGYDIACGNKAVRTNLKGANVIGDIGRIMDTIANTINFGVGRRNPNPVDHAVFDNPTWQDLPNGQELRTLAWRQLGTVGSGNHYVDIFIEPTTDDVWVGVHFGSRGFGHKTASGFLNLAAGRPFDGKAPGESMDQDPTILQLDTDLGQAYLAAMNLAGEYAYAGRDYAVGQVLGILGAEANLEVHNHHNFAWVEKHNGREVVVVRKGSTPNRPGQVSFVGGNMCDFSVIIQGKDAQENADSLYSTIHGAGRVMSRTAAAGKMNWKTRTRSGGQISPEQMYEAVRNFGVELRGAGTDESPFAYRKLQTVLDAHADTIDVLHWLKPIGVVMAGGDEYDPYKD